MEAIKTTALSKTYKNIEAVKEINLTVHQGELYSLLGTNGAGKSTTIKMLSCLETPTSGDGFLLGNSIKTDSQKVKSIINVSPQETAVAPNLSVKENLELIAAIHGFKGKDKKEKVRKIMEEFDMLEIEKQRAKTLSGGWQRKLSIAMALISEPKILFLDEPTLGLDVLARRELWKYIQNLKGKITIILTTHYLEEAEALSDRIGIMSKGRLKAEGTVDDLKALAGKDCFEEAFISIAEGESIK
ncbi:MAG: ABC transporter ATP-binding protein [Ruminococcus sp.]|nr:ABC transporter ATP-binding protein [Oscillospiraceae bacterium]